MHSVSVAGLSLEFDAFLRAPIYDERNGMLLSVLSALARMDIDPWQEAATLTELPQETAIQRLASLIAALPDAPLSDRNPATIAARLIALLPRRVQSTSQSTEDLPESSVMTASRKVAIMILLIIFLTAVIASQYLEISQPSPPPDKSKLVSPKTNSARSYPQTPNH